MYIYESTDTITSLQGADLSIGVQIQTTKHGFNRVFVLARLFCWDVEAKHPVVLGMAKLGDNH